MGRLLKERSKLFVRSRKGAYMDRKTSLVLTLILCFNFLIAPAKAYPEGKIFRFDLFGFDSPKLRIGSASVLFSALEKKFGKATFNKIDKNRQGGICILTGGKKYELFWYATETEGFDFTVEQTDENSSCPAGLYKEVTPEYISDYNIDKITYPANKFFPISGHYPEIRLGLSTADDIIKSFGRPFSRTKDELVYVLRRDREKEKGCDGSLQAISIEFEFKSKVLYRISMCNHILGEC